MNSLNAWREVWEENSREKVSDFELDRGISPRAKAIETLSTIEHINFIDPQKWEVVLDAGCGTGVNILRLHSLVRNIIGIDYASGSLQRCQNKLQVQQIHNAEVCQASLTAIPLPSKSINKILCLSVLQYLNDDEVMRAFNECVRVLAPGGTMILHVKNSSSLYWSSLRVAKKIKGMLGWGSSSYYVRSFQWYIDQLASRNFNVLECKSFNLLTVDKMPQTLVSFMQGFELRHQARICRVPFARHFGADLKIKAVLTAC